MHKISIAATGSLIVLCSITISSPVQGREPAELKSAPMHTKPARLPEASAVALFRDVIKEYAINEEAGKKLTSGKLKHSQLFNASSIDLNGDKVPELIVDPDPEKFDLPMHNPPEWILAKVGGKYKQILDAAGGVTLLRTKSGGYTDLCNAQHASAAETEIAIYKFNRGKYRAAKCYTQTYLNPDGSERKSPAFVKHACGSEYR